MATTLAANQMAKNGIAYERIVVLDFGSQFAQLIARRIREQNVFCEIVKHDIAVERLQEHAPRGIILSGGPNSVYEANAPQCDPRLFELGIPILGICYGMQLLCRVLGGRVDHSPAREYGRSICQLTAANDLMDDQFDNSQVWMSHADQVQQVSDDFLPLASTRTCPVAAVKHRTQPVYGIQFHPEVTHTAHGKSILRNFVRNICGCSGNWNMGDYAEQTIAQVRQRVGDAQVICGLSGGVDSSVVAALLYRAIGAQLSCILVDNGLLREGEKKSVVREFSDHFQTDLHVVDATDLFLSALRGVVNPQEKRRIIGHKFIECFKSEAEKISNAQFLAQGTLYPDVIESGASSDGPAATIKLHHNVGGLPDELGFELIEPLRDLFKDEVRKLGVELGMPQELVWRHPFPGPGLAVRCLGEVTAQRLNTLRAADNILLEEIRRADLYRATSQTFAVLLPIQTVGVMGDSRTYENVLAIRSVDSDDFMTADWSRLPHELLATLSTRIINEVSGINRVCYDISSKPPATIEWE